MTDPNDPIAPLFEKLEALRKRQQSFSDEINQLSLEIERIKFVRYTEEDKDKQEMISVAPEILDREEKGDVNIIFNEPSKRQVSSDSNSPGIKKSDLEKFIGENLINKIGIIITVIGVAIGAKYSIDHDLISPLARTILGYIIGIGLLGTGMRLKKNYLNYSAVLVSGAITILYFITYFAFSLYNLFPQSVAFFLMVLFTAYAILSAIDYNRQIIAHFGMVGAYAVPFLLGDSSGSVLILFNYIAIINIGILIISVNKYWKPLYYASFLISWLTYFSWYSQKFQTSDDFGLALTFLIVFFVIFYAVFLAYKLLKRELFDFNDVFLLLGNSFIFYGLGYSILKSDVSSEHMLGVFSLGNAVIHFGVSIIVYRQKLADRNLFYLVAGLVLVFITIAFPVQFDGNWVTLLWAGEAALLFWIGRSKNIKFYELFAYALIVLTFISIIHDWTTVYDCYVPGKPETRITPLFNINFLSSLMVIASFGYINALNKDQKYPGFLNSSDELKSFISILIPGTLLIIIYYSLRIEIETYWTQLFQDSLKLVEKGQEVPSLSYQNTDLLKFRSVWIINYSLFMASLLTFVNIKRLRSYDLGVVTLIVSAICIVFFLLQGLVDLSQLRDSYINQTLSGYYPRTWFNIGLRYISYSFAGLMLYAVFKFLNGKFTLQASAILRKVFDCVLHITLLWIVSSELNCWIEIFRLTQSSKLALTILWGIYALILIALGIWKKKKYLRLGAIVLFGITLYKLFFFDMEDLDTISKTTVFLSLGVLLLIISFLYNKYKHLISD